eukprot:5805020-Prymnesium_polylepis.1
MDDQRERIGRLLAVSLPDGGGGGSSDADGAELLAVLCSGGEVAKQLVCNYLQASGAADPAAVLGQKMLLCEWHSAASGAKQPILCSLYQEMELSAAAARRRQHAADRGLPLLTRDAILAAGRRLLSDNGAFGKLEPMLSYLLGTLQDAQPSSRTKTVKQLAAVVRADSDTLKLQNVTRAVQMALQDSSIAVREATLDLLGQFIVLRPEVRISSPAR